MVNQMVEYRGHPWPGRNLAAAGDYVFKNSVLPIVLMRLTYRGATLINRKVAWNPWTGCEMSEAPDPDQLKALDDRLEALKASQGLGPRSDEHFSQANQGWRMVTELVAGLMIGFGIGYGLDVLFGTLPIFLVLFVLLGLAAGINVMMRTAKEIQEDQVAKAAREEKDG